MSARAKAKRALAAAACVAAAGALCLPGAASAAYTTAAPIATDGARVVSSVAVNQSTHDVYAASYGGNAVPAFEAGIFQRFDSAGAEIACSVAADHPGGVAVDPVNSDLYVIDTKTAANTRLRVFPGACGAEKSNFPVVIGNADLVSQPATDAAGNIFVPNPRTDNVEKFSPAGALLDTPVEGLVNPVSIAFDSEGNFYVADGTTNGATNASGKVQKFEADGTPLGTFVSGEATTVAVDKSTDDVFVGKGWGTAFHIEKRSSAAGALLADFGAGAFVANPVVNSIYNQLAVDETSGRVFATDGGSSKVQRFDPAPKFALATNVIESGGTGTIECVVNETGPFPCEDEYEEGTTVTAIAVPPNPGSAFAGWTGDCDTIAEDECEVEIDGAKSITAEFIEGDKRLGIAKAGTGEGTVTSTPAGIPAGIDCGSECEAYFETGEAVELEATADAVSDFSGWATLAGAPGTCEGTTNPCTITMSEDAELEATFTRRSHDLTVEPTGNGSVAAEEPPAPLSGSIAACEESGGSCEATYFEGATITLEASPDPNHEVAWSGCTPVEGEPNRCEVTIPNGDSAVQADFTLEKRLLKVEKPGAGLGSVTGPEINCGSECEALFDHGTTVVLTATLIEGQFEGWQGCDAAFGPEGTECEVTLTADTTVKATFAAKALRKLEVIKGGTGVGTVASDPAGIDCGPTCEAEFEGEEVVLLSATSGPNSKPVVWSGCDEVTGGSPFVPDGLCKVVMEEDRAVTATFDLQERALTVVPTNQALAGGQVSAEAPPTPASGSVSECRVGGGTCNASYLHGDEVILVATPGASNEVSWGAGQCDEVLGPEGARCKVALTTARTVNVTFSLKTHALTTSTAGDGSGSVRCDNGPCVSLYPVGTTLEVKAAPDPHSTFEGWSVTGDPSTTCAGTASPCEVTIEGPVSIEASFAEDPKHNLVVVPSEDAPASGSVDGSPGPISNCREAGGICSGPHYEGDEITLTADPGPHSRVQWGTGECDEVLGSDGELCRFAMPAEAKAVHASFEPIRHALTLDYTGSGSGIVSCDDGSCAPRYIEGSTVTLSADPDPGSTFAGFSGAGCSGSGDCEVRVDGDASVDASFAGVPPAVAPPAPLAAPASPAPSRSCTAVARRARALSARAQRLRRAAKRSGNARNSARMRRAAKRSAGKARRLSRNARRCRAGLE